MKSTGIRESGSGGCGLRSSDCARRGFLLIDALLGSRLYEFVSRGNLLCSFGLLCRINVPKNDCVIASEHVQSKFTPSAMLLEGIPSGFSSELNA